MHSNEMRRRLDNIENSLSPRQVIVLAMENATSRFNSLEECTDWLAAHPGERLLGDPSEVWSTFGKRLKKEKPLALITSIIGELAGRAALAHLWLDCNRRIAEVTDKQLPRLALLAHRNSELMDHIRMSRVAIEALKLMAGQPYVLDGDDAAAIEAAITQQVQTQETLLSGDLGDWLHQDTAAAQSGSVDPFAHALHALIEAGEVKAGAAVELGTIPLEVLLLAPLVDGQWLDRHAVELAEFGALAQARGLTFRVSPEAHYLARLQAGHVGEDQQLAPADEQIIFELRQETKAVLATFGGRTMDIQGRPYLHIEDYRTWPGRKLEGDLPVLAGIVVPSWNSWVDHHGGEGRAELAGTKVRHLMPLADPRDFVVCSDPVELWRRRRRRVLELTKVRAILFHHAERMDWSYGDDIAQLLQNLFEADFTESAVSRSCFDGHQVLFNESRSKLRDQLSEAQEMASSYNRLLDLVFTRHQNGAGPGRRPSAIEINKIRQAAQDRSKMIVAALVGKAKSEVRIGIDCSNRAHKMMGPVVKQLENYFR